MPQAMLTGASFVVLGRIATLVIQLGSAMLLARLLTPSEFGVFSVGAAAVGLLQGFREFGAANYIVRAERADRETVGCALTVSATLSFGLGAALLLAAEPLGAFYDKDGVVLIIRILAINFFVTPGLMLGAALLTRVERFGTRVAVEVFAAAIGAIASVALAAGQLGAISLALGMTANSVAAFAGYLYVRPAGFSLVPSIRGVSSAFKFGLWLSGINVASQAAERGTDLLIGKILGFAAVGYFDKGWAAVRIVNSFFSSVLHSVVFATTAREQRAGTDAGELYVARLALLTGILWPALAFLFVHAKATVLLLFGDQWMPAVPVAQGASFVVMLLIPITLGDQVLIVRGSEAKVFFYKLRYALARLLIVLVTAPFGIAAIAYSLAFAAAYQIWMQRNALERDAHLAKGWWKHSLGPSVRLTALVVVVMWLVDWSLPFDNEGALTLAIGAFAGLLAWISGTYLERSRLSALRNELFAALLDSARLAGGRRG